MRVLRSLTIIAAAMLALAFDPLTALAAGSSTSQQATQPAKDPTFAAAEKAVKAGDSQGAIPLLERVVAANPRHADALNYLGFANRKLGRLDTALAFYQRALAVDPDHHGAHEYLGELYLQMKDLAKAEEHLKRLDELCFFGCEEYSDLKKAIEAYKAKTAG